jgi:hypothetical protein
MGAISSARPGIFHAALRAAATIDPKGLFPATSIASSSAVTSEKGSPRREPDAEPTAVPAGPKRKLNAASSVPMTAASPAAPC